MFLHLFLFLTGTLSIYSQVLVRLGIIDDHDHQQTSLNIDIPNITFCDQQKIRLQVFWINSSYSPSDLADRLERQDNITHIYLARTAKFSTRFIQDFCQTHRLPFIAMRSISNRLLP
jgi:hypothetical protein